MPQSHTSLCSEVQTRPSHLCEMLFYKGCVSWETMTQKHSIPIPQAFLELLEFQYELHDSLLISWSF